MNTKQAKQIPLPEVLHKLGFSPQRKVNHNIWYFSPFREEKTPSFKINTHLNRWYDFGEGTGGSIIDLFMALYRVDLPRALEKISDLTGYIAPVTPQKIQKVPLAVNTPVIQAVKELHNPALSQYLHEIRGRHPDLARL